MSTVTPIAYAPTATPLDGLPRASRLARGRGLADALLHCFDATNAFLKWTFTRASTSETSEIEDMFFSLSLRGIRIPDVAAVRDYLLRYPDMTDVVALVCDLAADHFEPGTQLSMEVYHDPEIEDEYLTLYVRQDRYREGLLDTVDSLCELCERELAQGSGWLLVTTDFAAPK